MLDLNKEGDSKSIDLPKDEGNDIPAGKILFFRPHLPTSTNLKEAQKLNYALMQHHEVHSKSGVYYYYTQDSDDSPPEWYAGQAIHLGLRAGNTRRIEDKDCVILICLNDEEDNEPLRMDENWRQHLESLMIRDLADREYDFGIIKQNSKDERKSVCLKKEQNRIKCFFEKVKQCLKDKNVPGFDESSITWEKKKEDWVPIILKNSRTTYVDSGKGEAIFVSDLPTKIKIKAGARASSSMWSVNVEVQEYKQDLIDEGILVKAGTPKDGIPEYYEFEKDHIFHSSSWATRVIKNTNQGWKSAGWIKEESKND